MACLPASVWAQSTSSTVSGNITDPRFDTTQFTLPASFTMGNISRTLPDVRGPGVASVDFSLSKNTRIREKVALQFRAEAFASCNSPSS